MNRFFAFLVAVGIVLAGALRVSAQEIVPIGTRRLYKLEELLENMDTNEFEAVAVTYLPAQTVLWLDDAPLGAYTILDAETAARVYLFSAENQPTAGIGVTPMEADPLQRNKVPMRIRSVNPDFFHESVKVLEPCRGSYFRLMDYREEGSMYVK